jgi:hypothetical protein
MVSSVLLPQTVMWSVPVVVIGLSGDPAVTGAGSGSSPGPALSSGPLVSDIPVWR